jgi:hypothetical protein
MVAQLCKITRNLFKILELKTPTGARCQWLLPIFLAPGEAEIKDHGSEPAQRLCFKVHKTPSQLRARRSGAFLLSQAMQEVEIGRILVPGQP